MIFFFFLQQVFHAKDQLSNCHFISYFILESKNVRCTFMMDFINKELSHYIIISLYMCVLASWQLSAGTGDAVVNRAEL